MLSQHLLDRRTLDFFVVSHERFAAIRPLHWILPCQYHRLLQTIPFKEAYPDSCTDMLCDSMSTSSICRFLTAFARTSSMAITFACLKWEGGKEEQANYEDIGNNITNTPKRTLMRPSMKASLRASTGTCKKITASKYKKDSKAHVPLHHNFSIKAKRVHHHVYVWPTHHQCPCTNLVQTDHWTMSTLT